MHPDGYLRGRAVRALAASGDPLSDTALAVRVSDHVTVIRELAARDVLQRTTLEQAERIMPMLHRIEQRGRGADVLPLYLDALVSEHGESQVWARLRKSSDHDLRRTAFRYSLDRAVLTTEDAVTSLPHERDPIVRRLLARVIADNASADVVADALLRARSADSRALGLVCLTATQLDPTDVERLLVDSSVLVRLWARRRWQEMGHDPATTYRRVTRSAAKPRERAQAYVGLAETGTVVDRNEVLELVGNEDLALQQVGLRLLADQATTDDIPGLLTLVTGNQSRVARLASDVLARNPGLWSVDDLAGLRGAENPEFRRRAWWIHRSRRGWEAVIADLEVLRDQDPQLAVLGRQPTAPMYLQPDEHQQRRIAALLPNTALSRDQMLSIALSAGLPDLMTTIRDAERGQVSVHDAEPAKNTLAWWQRIWKRE